ncbi:MAG: 3-keto-disaccharide hydrolase [Pirellulales bacterium]
MMRRWCRSGLAGAVIVAMWAVAGAAAEPGGTALVGRNLDAWRKPTGDWSIVGKAYPNADHPELLSTEPGAGLLVNGPKGRTDNLISKKEHGDVEAHVEFMVPKGSNSGVYFQARYEIQIFDSWGVADKDLKTVDCGSIYERWENDKGFEGHPPRVNVSRKPGEWQTLDVVFRAPRFDKNGKKTANARFVKVVFNGTPIHENVELTGPTRASTYNDEKATGPIMFQGDHGPVAYRNMRIRPVKLGD